MFVRRAYIPDAVQPTDSRVWPFTVPCVAELATRGVEFTLLELANIRDPSQTDSDTLIMPTHELEKLRFEPIRHVVKKDAQSLRDSKDIYDDRIANHAIHAYTLG